MEARYYTSHTDDKVQCLLCPHNCIIANHKAGICKIRSNTDGILYSEMYGSISASHIDPIEKKPLYHFYPGSEILSLGGLGCNFHCSCCQNYEISQSGKTGFPRLQNISVDEIVKIATANMNNLGVAYTYNEPFIWYEYMFDIAEQIRNHGGRNVVVSNGYINERPLKDILPLIDAFNIDIKSFDEKTHRQFTGGDLKYVLNTLKFIAEAEKHLEITLLIVPGINDTLEQFEKMIGWIIDNLDRDVPLHLSRYFPHYRMKNGPTDYILLEEFASYAGKYLNYIYIGNTTGGDYQNTRCPNCGSLVIQREGYNVNLTALDARGYCTSCGQKIAVS